MPLYYKRHVQVLFSNLQIEFHQTPFWKLSAIGAANIFLLCLQSSFLCTFWRFYLQKSYNLFIHQNHYFTRLFINKYSLSNKKLCRNYTHSSSAVSNSIWKRIAQQYRLVFSKHAKQDSLLTENTITLKLIRYKYTRALSDSGSQLERHATWHCQQITVLPSMM